MADDLRDLTAPADLGRRPGTDLREGVLTLPVLLLLSRGAGAPALRASLRELQAGNEAAVDRCRTIVLGSDAIARARAMLREVWCTALAHVERVRPAGLRAALADHAGRVWRWSRGEEDGGRPAGGERARGRGAA